MDSKREGEEGKQNKSDLLKIQRTNNILLYFNFDQFWSPRHDLAWMPAIQSGYKAISEAKQLAPLISLYKAAHL